MANNTIKDILNQYQSLRDYNKLMLKERKQKIYESHPTLADIDLQISQIGSDISKAILKNPKNAAIMLDELKMTLEQLKLKKAIYLTDHNIPIDALSLQYQCQKCEDTGFDKSGGRCSCFTQKLIDMAYEMSNVQKVMNKQNFSHFDLSIFSTEPTGREPLSQRENMMNILAEAEAYVKAFPQGKNILLYGSSGLGKTFLCNCIAKSLLDSGYSVIYQTPFSIIHILEKKAFTDKTNPLVLVAYEQLFQCDLLIIDDLGTETANTFTISEFYNIINTRILNEKSTIISTNIKLSELSAAYNDRIDSRIKGHYQLIKFYGPDVRWET